MESVEFEDLLRAREMSVELNGWVATVYGYSSLSVRNPKGEIVYHTVDRDENLCTEEGLKRLIEGFYEQGT